MQLSPMFHVGIVVPDLDKAKGRFAELLGAMWGPTIEFDARIVDGGDAITLVHLKFVYSCEAPYIELIEEVRGTPWQCNEFSNLHHIGFFADDVVLESERMTDAGCPYEAGALAGDGKTRSFAYHRDSLGIRLEFVSEARRAAVEDLYTRIPMLAPSTRTEPEADRQR